jgi:putative membrane protein
MKVFWGLGRLLTLLFWCVVVVNLLLPFVHPLHLLVNLAGALLLALHGLELLFSRLKGRANPWRDRLRILLFGVFHLQPSRPRPLRRLLPMRKLCLLAAFISPWPAPRWSVSKPIP